MVNSLAHGAQGYIQSVLGYTGCTVAYTGYAWCIQDKQRYTGLRGYTGCARYTGCTRVYKGIQDALEYTGYTRVYRVYSMDTLKLCACSTMELTERNTKNVRTD